jgi:putative transferase (TIGR04331 family)
MVSKMLAIGVKRDEAFFIADYLSLCQSFSLQRQLGQMPLLWRTIAPASVAVNSDARRWRLKDASDSDFERALRSLIPLQIPTIYLEGYSRLMEQVSALPWPQHPRFIFTSNSYYSDDVFKAWAAEKVEAGAPFIIGQHGGHYGLGRSYFTEEHEMAISDRFLSWGWEEEGNNKIKPVGNLKMAGRRLGWDPEGCALMVEMTMSRYSYHMFSAPVSSQWLSYSEDQFRFVDALPRNLREELRVRIYGQDYGWCQKKRWQDRFPKICLDRGTAPLASLIKKSRLYISTYNSTTFLESLAMNIPTLIFWDPGYWELRAGAQPYFDRLKEAGIFHETPESAAAKMAEVWNDVPGWWDQPEIQEARTYFCHRFSRMPEDPLSVLKEALTTAKSGGSN